MTSLNPKDNLHQRLLSALEKRVSISSHDSFRLIDSMGDEVPGLYLDKVGLSLTAHIHGINSAHSQRLEEELSRLPQETLHRLGVTTVYAWSHLKSAHQTAKSGAQRLHGPELTPYTIKEGALSLIIKPEGNVNGGFFLDMRSVREYLAKNSRDAKVLNLFCFTGSLGLASFVGGAKEVVQVDVSKMALTWARENFEINRALGAGEMRFIPEDSLVFLEKEQRRIERGKEGYDLVIVDPPSFGAGGKKPFSLTRDAASLLDASFAVLKKEGRLFFSTNNREIAVEDVEDMVTRAAQRRGRGIKSLTQLLPPPEEFTAPLEDSIAMKGVLVAV